MTRRIRVPAIVLLALAVAVTLTALGTPMPAFKDALGETDRWKIIRFLSALQ